MSWTSDWGRDEKAAYAKGIEKGQRLAGEGERDRIARAALMGILSNGYSGSENSAASLAYSYADAMLKAKYNDEIPF